MRRGFVDVTATSASSQRAAWLGEACAVRHGLAFCGAGLRLRLGSAGLALVVGALSLLAGCQSSVIQNLGAIEAQAAFRLNALDVQIDLLTDAGDRLLWDANITGPVSDVLPVERLDTHLAIWSLRNGHRNTQVYSGRLRGLRWTTGFPTTYRSLKGDVPVNAYGVDTEADTPLGEIDVTLTTPKQGDFTTTVFDVQIFSAAYF